MARPKKSLNLAQLKALMRMKPTLEDAASFFSCSPDTIERVIRENAGCSFAEFRHQNMVSTRNDLVRSALQGAAKGNTALLIFCLKNLCGWSDKAQVQEEASVKVIQLAYKLD